jgi:hypothetical protein
MYEAKNPSLKKEDEINFQIQIKKKSSFMQIHCDEYFIL